MGIVRIKEYHVETLGFAWQRTFVHRPVNDRFIRVGKRHGVIFHNRDRDQFAVFETNRSIDWVHDV